jgi:hypothetical protein
MSYFSKRALRWAAPVTLVGALGLAACGNSDDTEAVRVAAPSAAGLGSDQHLNNQAEEIARASANAGSDQHLNNQAAEIASQRATRAGSANRAVQMTQAPAYVWQLRDRAVSSSSNRAAQMAQAEQYVGQLQDRAVSSSSGDDFLPGSRHVPVR